MTLLLSLSNCSHAIVLGDRRVAQRDGKACDDEANKLCVLFCDDARVTIAFTGLASYNGFKTQDWLRDTLFEIGKKTHTLEDILRAFQAKASHTFASLSRAIGNAQRIAFLLSGFRYSPNAQNICYLISNYGSHAHTHAPSDKVDLYPLGTVGSPTVEAAGYTSAFTQRDRESLRKMLAADNPPPKVLRKAVQIVQRVSMDKKSRGFVGAQCNSGVVPQKRDTNIVATYHSAKPAFRAFGPDVVLAVTDCGAAVTGTFLHAGLFLSGPEIRKSEPCWCGSGRRFGTCHYKKFGSVYARMPAFRKPMQWVVAFSKKSSELSGRRYVVTSSFE
ncbi:MAG TPA: SEC-C domain-containing protein [Thermoguttaceae bacterium]|nr:SEC-C domain-containing protein [Thermoguttaceae bacterium]